MHDSRQHADARAVTFNALNPSSGVCFYTLKADGNVRTKRMVVLK